VSVLRALLRFFAPEERSGGLVLYCLSCNYLCPTVLIQQGSPVLPDVSLAASPRCVAVALLSPAARSVSRPRADSARLSGSSQ
jgi:hypothetical protein